VQATRPAETSASTPPATKPDDADEPLPPLEYEAELPASVREAMYQRYTGDLDELVKRRVVRVGVTYNRTHYFVDNGEQRGVTYEFGAIGVMQAMPATGAELKVGDIHQIEPNIHAGNPNKAVMEA
jgi:hypothetical protein